MLPQSNTAHANTGRPPKINYNPPKINYNPLKCISRHENLNYYRPGGYHPIHIGDRLGESGRFIVVRKLGYGTFGTVWMCWDTESKKLKAVKIMQAEQSQADYKTEVGLLARLSEADGQVSVEDAYRNHLAVPLERFWQYGPNGRHLCIVMPVLGPNVRRAKALGDVDFLKDVCSQITGGLAFLHSKEMAHGDLHPGNILIQTTISDLDLRDIHTFEPYSVEHLVAEGSDGPGPYAPRYICECFDWTELDPKYFKKEIAIIDFGTSFKISDPPDYQTIDTSLRAPENFFDAFPSQASDLWALGCTMMSILGSQNPFYGRSEEETWPPVPLWEDALGPLPQPYRAQWIAAKRHIGKRTYDGVEDSEPISVSSELLARIKRSRLDQLGNEDAIFACLARPTILRVQASEQKRQQQQQDKTKAGEYGDGAGAGNGNPAQEKTWSLPSEELDSAVSLVRSLFKYNPFERTPASELLAHPFLTKKPPLPPSSPSSTRRPYPELQPSEDQASGQSSRDPLDEEDLPVRGGGAVDARDADAAEEEETDLGSELWHGVH